MQTRITTILATLLLAAAAVPAVAGADFISVTPTGKLAASHAVRPILPTDDVVFENNSAALIDSAQTQVARVAYWAKMNPGMIVLEGHSDSVGGTTYNEALSLRRAEAVREALLQRGLPSKRILIVVFGEASAQAIPNPIDRRVVIYASTEPAERILRAAVARQGHPVDVVATR